jgi:raffinose/stachyose/melibiose transport system permease protein
MIAGKKASRIVGSILLSLLGLSWLYPLIWMLSLSFKESGEIYSNPFGLPNTWIFSNYPNALAQFDFLLYFMNSVIYSFSTVAIVLICGSMFAYCVARMKWKLKATALSYISLGLIIPAQVTIIPLYMLLRQLGIKDTHMALILPYSAFALALCVLMIYAFLRSLPVEMEEAAIIDGCNIYRCFGSIILPIIRPALATQIILTFINTWNEFFLAYIITGKESLRPLPIGLLNFFIGRGINQWGYIGATMVVASIPAIILYLLFSEQIENALTAGAILK